MSNRCRPMIVAFLFLGLALPAAAQTAGDHLAMGRTAEQDRDPQTALAHFEEALAFDPGSYEASWRAAQALVDIGKQTPDSVKSPSRDSLYARAESLARVAVAADSSGADGHYILAAAIGRASLTKSKKERVRRAAEIRSEALRAIELQPDHDRAYHVMGRWNAEIMRLSGLTRFFAKSFLGGKIFKEASWQGAIDNMSKAVELAPESIYHRLDLAEIFIDQHRYTEARPELERVEALPLHDVMDPSYKEDAARLLKEIESKKDKS
ncbi:MAG: tetratricopeptide repeat protein [Gemmatimonadales bacterium]